MLSLRTRTIDYFGGDADVLWVPAFAGTTRWRF
jgi:hypothetical protein